MISVEFVKLMAAYSVWQQGSIHAAADRLSEEERRRDRGAFFGSIHATLNHLLWADQLWLSRLAGTPAPEAPDIPSSLALHATWDALQADRRETNRSMLNWSERVTEADLAGELSWFSGAIGAEVRRPRWALVVQLFNHGTHHRGQVHAMLTAAGEKLEDTDVPFMPDDHYRWPD